MSWVLTNFALIALLRQTPCKYYLSSDSIIQINSPQNLHHVGCENDLITQLCSFDTGELSFLSLFIWDVAVLFCNSINGIPNDINECNTFDTIWNSVSMEKAVAIQQE